MLALRRSTSNHDKVKEQITMAPTTEDRILLELRAMAKLLETLIAYHESNSKFGVSSNIMRTAQRAREDAALELAETE